MASIEPLTNDHRMLRTCWHAVAVAADVGTDPVDVELLGERFVLARLPNLVAFVDRCPHRLAPLSAGSICESSLQCGYHGWRFDSTGECVEVPALGPGDTIPPRARLTAPAAVAEHAGLIWLALDEPVAELPDFVWWDRDGFDRIVTTVVDTPVSAGQLVDNFLDAAHFPFVHPASFGVDEAAVVRDRGITRDEHSVETVFDTWYRNIDDPLVDSGDHPAVQPQVLTKRGHLGLTVTLCLGFPTTGATLAILFVCSPRSATETRVFKLVARDDLGGDAGRIARCLADEDQILSEDLAILERYERMELHLDPRIEVHTKADRLSVAWRKLMADASG